MREAVTYYGWDTIACCIVNPDLAINDSSVVINKVIIFYNDSNEEVDRSTITDVSVKEYVKVRNSGKA